MYLTDVTIREAGQLPGRNYDISQKVAAAHALDELGLPSIQATFPATGPRDREVTHRLADSLEADLVALARTRDADVTACLETGADVVEVFGTLSAPYLEHVVGLEREEMLSALGEQTDRVRDAGATPHVTFLDGFRTDVAELRRGYETLSAVPVITLADTTGSSGHRAVREFLTTLTDTVDADRVGVHFHDDLGVAVANLLEAQQVGVQRADVSVGGIGERAGNVALEQVVARAALDEGESFGLNHAELVPRCQEVLRILGEDLDAWRPLIGGNVFNHEAGIHTRAMLKQMRTFEPFDPERFGGDRRLLFGKGTGRSGARFLLERIDGPTDEETVSQLLSELRGGNPVEFEEALVLAEAVVNDR